VLYTIHIKNKEERIRLAADIKNILHTAGNEVTEYIPSQNKKLIKSDIGIKANNIEKKTLAQILSQIERRGYSVFKAKGPDNPSLELSAGSPQTQQKTTGEIKHGIIT
tara:strand:+ start:15799 stop:16122 length:324 start_codon:yes stop_codon:yes gene_type:complete